MNLTKIRSKIKSKAVTLSILMGILIVGGLSVQAQYPSRDYGQNDRYDRWGRDRDWNRRRGGSGNMYGIARDRGYQDGLNVGAEDTYKRKSYDPERSHYFRNATYGYSSSYGNKNAYKDAYRDGFLRGYQQGYRRNGGRWGR
ncbi:MAG: hypothetical protein QOH96_816 [Blastocatellia bacterium]|nr:hypothetical protein [Blastocatellia bacterium]